MPCWQSSLRVPAALLQQPLRPSRRSRRTAIRRRQLGHQRLPRRLAAVPRFERAAERIRHLAGIDPHARAWQTLTNGPQDIARKLGTATDRGQGLPRLPRRFDRRRQARRALPDQRRRRLRILPRRRRALAQRACRQGRWPCRQRRQGHVPDRRADRARRAVPVVPHGHEGPHDHPPHHGRGHPRLSFELDTFTSAAPALQRSARRGPAARASGTACATGRSGRAWRAGTSRSRPRRAGRAGTASFPNWSCSTAMPAIG